MSFNFLRIFFVCIVCVSSLNAQRIYEPYFVESSHKNMSLLETELKRILSNTNTSPEFTMFKVGRLFLSMGISAH